MPFDLAAAEAFPDWRERLAWPVPHAELTRRLRTQLRCVLDFVAGLDDDDLRAIMLLASQAFLPPVRALAQAALWIQAERKTGIRLAGGPPELAYLRGEWDADRPPPCSISVVYEAPPRVRAVTARRVARIHSWTPWWRLPATLVAPT
ncbi:MAG: hypothetical protein V3U23_07845, partial [Kiloniellales bacterium]